MGGSMYKMQCFQIDTLAEWLRRRPAKPVGSARVGSNPTGVDFAIPLVCPRVILTYII